MWPLQMTSHASATETSARWSGGSRPPPVAWRRKLHCMQPKRASQCPVHFESVAHCPARNSSGQENYGLCEIVTSATDGARNITLYGGQNGSIVTNITSSLVFMQRIRSAAILAPEACSEDENGFIHTSSTRVTERLEPRCNFTS